jgi:tetratricopeptide (TPR) repeat protein
VNAPRLPRRVFCAVFALCVAFALLRSPLAESIVTRGDDALRAGDVATAVRSYRKALTLDPGSLVAADRLAFQLALRHRSADAQAAVRIASQALRLHPGSVPLLADRAFAHLQLHHWSAAQADFQSAGTLAADPRYRSLAAQLALRHALR